MRLLVLLSCLSTQYDDTPLNFPAVSIDSPLVLFLIFGTLHYFLFLDIEEYDYPSLFHELHIRIATVCLYSESVLLFEHLRRYSRLDHNQTLVSPTYYSLVFAVC